MNFRKRETGFTLIELLVVIAIIGILAAVVMASLNSARAKSRDAKRKSDLHQISLALELNKATNNTYAIPNAPGYDWFSYISPYHTKSAAQSLVDEGFMANAAVDPSGVTTYTAPRQGYMYFADADHYTLWANLENPTAADLATQNSCYSSVYDSHYSSYPAASQMNYCISN